MTKSKLQFRFVCAQSMIAILVFATSCARSSPPQIANSVYPIAVDARRVGSYPALTKSGAGYFYDDVLEYRVWINPPEGGDDYYKPFARFEDAAEFFQKTLGAEEPLVLILQRQWIDEPQPGVFVVHSEERITEWRVEWLANSKRSSGSIERFLEEHKANKSKGEGSKPSPAVQQALGADSP
jgi:putative acetyltransferase